MPIVDIRANRKIRREQPSTTNNNTPGGKYSPSDISALREQWFERCSDLLGPIPLELPPFREVNHRIPLIDENLRYNYHLPRCPEALQEELRQKITRYTTAGWWEMKAVYLVICTGNPRVFFAVPGPVPVNNPYPLQGYGYSHGLAKINPGSTRTRTCHG
jgi:hypothetical protein